MTSLVFRWRMTVEFGHCDPAGMVSPKRLFEYFDTGTWSLFEAALGIKRADFLTTFGILPLVDVRLACRKAVKSATTSRLPGRRRRRFAARASTSITACRAMASAVEAARPACGLRNNSPEKISARTIPADIIARFG